MVFLNIVIIIYSYFNQAKLKKPFCKSKNAVIRKRNFGTAKLNDKSKIITAKTSIMLAMLFVKINTPFATRISMKKVSIGEGIEIPKANTRSKSDAIKSNTPSIFNSIIIFNI